MPDAAPPPPPPVTPPTAARRGVGCVLPVLALVLLASLLVNALLGFFLARDLGQALQPDTAVRETFYLGDPAADDRVAVVRIEGVISELTSGYPVRQMVAAAADGRVKAVVLRVNSPGGTVGASDELYQCLVNLRDDTGRRFPGTGPKPLSVSLGPVAASGGYYVAAAGRPIVAERTTITGSIGVFAALPNVAKLAADNGVKLELVKAGGIKASGSFFHDLSPDERQTWQDVVDSAYDTFLGVIAAGRPLTAAQLRTAVVIDQQIPQRDAKGNPKLDAAGQPLTARYTRTRADGGTFTAVQAVQFGLIDGVDDLPGAVRAAARAAGLTRFRAVTYDRPPGLIDYLAPGLLKAAPGRPLDPQQLADALTPRLWYLSPSADAALLTPSR